MAFVSFLCSSRESRRVPFFPAFRGERTRVTENVFGRQNSCHITWGYVTRTGRGGRGYGVSLWILGRGGGAGGGKILAVLEKWPEGLRQVSVS